MFVRLVKKNNDHVSVRIVENRREGKKVKQKTICCVGHTHKSNKDKIQMLKRLGHNLIRDMKEEMQMVFSGIQDSIQPPVRQVAGLKITPICFPFASKAITSFEDFLYFPR